MDFGYGCVNAGAKGGRLAFARPEDNLPPVKLEDHPFLYAARFGYPNDESGSVPQNVITTQTFQLLDQAWYGGCQSKPLGL